MIKAFFVKKDKATYVSISGHACYSKPDIVCAAASILVNTFKEATRAVEFEGKTEPGNAWFYIPDDSVCPNVFFLKKGMRLLAKEYPENVCVKEAILTVMPEDLFK